MRRGFTLIELMVTVAIVVIVGVLLLPNLRGRRTGVELDLTTRQIATLLREAQGKAISEASSTSWGVRFDNTATSTAFYALYAETYSTTTASTRANLPRRVQYATSSVPVGSAVSILFGQGTGRPSASSTIRLLLTENAGNVTSTTISVSSFGAISF